MNGFWFAFIAGFILGFAADYVLTYWSDKDD